MTQFISTRGVTFVALVLGTLASACASDQKQPVTSEEVRDGEALPPAPPVPEESSSSGSSAAATMADVSLASDAAPAATTESLSEAQVAKIADLVNSAEVEQGKLAKGKAKAADVKRFADMMVRHHGEAKAEQAKLFKKLNLTPAESATATALKADGERTLESLKNSDADGFDAAYAKSQVDGHQKVRNALDTQLLPAAKTPELADGLRKMKATVESHLAEAKKLQTATLQASK